MNAVAFQITSLTIVYSTVYSRRKSKKTSMLRAFVRRIHRWPVNSQHKWPLTRRKCFHLMTSSHYAHGSHFLMSCCGLAASFFPYSSGLFHCMGNLTIASVNVKFWVWYMDHINPQRTALYSKTKPCIFCGIHSTSRLVPRGPSQ